MEGCWGGPAGVGSLQGMESGFEDVLCTQDYADGARGAVLGYWPHRAAGHGYRLGLGLVPLLELLTSRDQRARGKVEEKLPGSQKH